AVFATRAGGHAAESRSGPAMIAVGLAVVVGMTNIAKAPVGVTRSIVLFRSSTNQTFPSGPRAIAPGLALPIGRGYKLNVPLFERRATEVWVRFFGGSL